MTGELRHTITLAPPRVDGGTVHFAWTTVPETPMYDEPGFSVTFPDSVPLGDIPPSLWWRFAITCLYGHWALLGPCRVELPVRLAPGEAEMWMRLIDTTANTMRLYGLDAPPGRLVEIAESGPALERVPPPPDDGRFATAYSSGKDSLVSAGLLAELTQRPLLVTTTSPASFNTDHTAPVREQVLGQIEDRLGVELVRVGSDMRARWNQTYPWDHRGYSRAMSEITDMPLYLAITAAVARARGMRHAVQASEVEVQMNSEIDGIVVQHPHLAYSAITHAAIAAAWAAEGMTLSSVTYPLHSMHVQQVLWTRYAALADLQYSCGDAQDGSHGCSECGECRLIVLRALASGRSPLRSGLDPVRALRACRDWTPTAADRDRLPHTRTSAALHDDIARSVRAINQGDIGTLMRAEPTVAADPGLSDALAAFGELSDRLADRPVAAPPGYRAGLLELVDPRVREPLRAILDEHYAPAPDDELADVIARVRQESAWITAPLTVSAPRGEDARAADVSPPGRVTLTDHELDRIAGLIPDPEPELRVAEARPGEWTPTRVIPVYETELSGNEARYVEEAIHSNWISSAGAYIRRFEEAFAAAVGCRYAVACTSGTAALQLALTACGIGPGDEVVIPTFTMIATANTVRRVGATVVLADSELETWNVDPMAIQRAITPATRAIIAVHTYGHPAEMAEIEAIAQRNGIVVIEDAAEAHGARHRDRAVGSIGRAGAFSFYGNKILTTGEGGMVTTDDEDVAIAARELRDHGFSPERHFWHRRHAFNYRMTNLQAAIGLAQVERLDELVTRHRSNAAQYTQALAGIPGVVTPPEAPWARNVYWMYGIRVTGEFGCSRDELRRRLGRRGIDTRCFFVPMHAQPIFAREHVGARFPVAEELGRTGLYLPSAPGLTAEEIAYVAREVQRAGAGQG